MFVWIVSNLIWFSSFWSWISFSLEVKLVRSSTRLVPFRSASHDLQYQCKALYLCSVGRSSCSISAHELCHQILQPLQWIDLSFFLKFSLHLPHLSSAENVDLFRVMNPTSKQLRGSYTPSKSQHWKDPLIRRAKLGKPLVSSWLSLFLRIVFEGSFLLDELLEVSLMS